jgi:hypothetical protein
MHSRAGVWSGSRIGLRCELVRGAIKLLDLPGLSYFSDRALGFGVRAQHESKVILHHIISVASFGKVWSAAFPIYDHERIRFRVNHLPVRRFDRFLTTHANKCTLELESTRLVAPLV